MKPIIGVPAIAHEMDGLLGNHASLANQSYLRALEATGGAPLIIPITDREDTLRAVFERIDGLLLAGGGDVAPACFGEEPIPELGQVEKERDWLELTITPWALAEGMPVLGICRGIQSLNVAAGGTLWQDIPAQVPGTIAHRDHHGYPYNYLAHTVEISQDSRLAGILSQSEVQVNTLHHQSVKTVGAGLHVVGTAPDGIIEALEGNGDGWVTGVQWHPEWLLDEVPPMKRLFRAFVEACAAYRDAKRA